MVCQWNGPGVERGQGRWIHGFRFRNVVYVAELNSSPERERYEVGGCSVPVTSISQSAGVQLHSKRGSE
jgi:hypothetical protein